MTTNATKTAVITGASSGLGQSFARRLAAEGYNLLITARRKEQLEAFRDELIEKHGVRVEVYVADLSDDQQVKHLADHIQTIDDLEMLVNNAGFGTAGNIVDVDIESQVHMIQVHVVAPLRLMHAALQGMKQRRRGEIINVASMASFLYGAGSASYCATKACILNYSRSIAAEVRPLGIRVQALCPGFIYTGFHDTKEMENFERSQIPKPLWMNADFVVNYSLKCLRRGKVVCIPKWFYRVGLAIFLTPGVSTVLRFLFEGRMNRTDKK